MAGGDRLGLGRKWCEGALQRRGCEDHRPPDAQSSDADAGLDPCVGLLAASVAVSVPYVLEATQGGPRAIHGERKLNPESLRDPTFEQGSF